MQRNNTRCQINSLVCNRESGSDQRDQNRSYEERKIRYELYDWERNIKMKPEDFGSYRQNNSTKTFFFERKKTEDRMNKLFFMMCRFLQLWSCEINSSENLFKGDSFERVTKAW